MIRNKNAALAACTIGNMVSVTPMLYTVFGLFLIPISSEFNWPRAAVSGVLFVLAVMAALSYPVIGRAIDHVGPRRILIPGIVAFALCLAPVSQASGSLLQFYGFFVVLGIAAAVPSTAMYTKVIAGWFDARRGFALGVAGGVGNGVGAALSPLLVAWLITQFGWRGAFLGIGIVILVIGLPTLFVLLGDPPTAPEGEAGRQEGATLQEALRKPRFWVLLTAIALGAGSMTAIFAHVVPMLIDRGIPEGQAVSVLVTFSTVTAIWQVGIGVVLDRFPRPWIAALFYLIAVAGLLLLDRGTTQTALLFAGALMGLGLGTEYGVLPYLLSRYFGVAHYGAISGVAYGAIALIQGLTPFLMDLDYDYNGSYQLAVLVTCGVMMAGAVLLLRLPRAG